MATTPRTEATGDGSERTRQIVRWHAEAHDVLDRHGVSRFRMSAEGSHEYTLAERIDLWGCEGDADKVEPARIEGTEPLVSVTMGAAAARRFFKALVWAAGAADDEGRQEDYDWLAWGAGRVTMATPSSVEDTS